MNCPHDDIQLDEYVDGELDETSRRPLERHLAECERCGDEVRRRRRLRDAVARLPREIEPDRDLLDGIRERALAGEPAAPRGRGPVGRRWLAAAAALLLVGAIAFIAGRQSREAALPTASTERVAGQGIPDYRVAEREYLEATASLMEELERVREQLPPKTLADIEENLRIIDRAIDEVHAALDLESAPGRDGQLLAALHKKKLETLWRATRLSS